MNRARDWRAQAEKDLAAARRVEAGGDHEWAAFMSQQAAEKAVKAVVYSRGGEPWGHSVRELLQALSAEIPVPAETIDAGSRLDVHYMPARYPNGLPAGYPGLAYTAAMAGQALIDADLVLSFCRGRMA